MHPSDIEQRYKLLPPISVAWLKRLKDLGVSTDALCQPELPAQAQIVMAADFRFDFADEADGQPVDAMIFLGRDEDGDDPCDLIAWEPRLNRMASMYGNAPLLGMELLYGPLVDPDGALEVFPTPKEWLLAERHGVVIVDPKYAASILRNAEPLKVHDLAFGQRLASLINPQPPRIFAPSASTAKAG